MARIRREWVIGGLMVFAVMMAAGGLWVAGLNSGEEESMASPAASRPGVVPARWEGPVPSKVAERFVMASSHQERLRWVRHPERVDAAMKAFFSTGPGAREKVKDTWLLQENSSGSMVFQEFLVEIEGEKPRLLSVSVDPAGAKVDFDCYAMRGSASWDQLLAGQVDSADEMKVVLKANNFYLHGFADEGRWQHYHATAPDLEEGADLYIPRNDPMADEMMRRGSDPFRATVSLRQVGGSASRRQFEVTEVKSLGWTAVE